MKKYTLDFFLALPYIEDNGEGKQRNKKAYPRTNNRFI